jgi:hypothetical protein
VDGFVETWYDQSGNGNDATQSVAGNQPKIVDGGSLVAGGLDFDGVDDTLISDTYSRSGEDLPFSMFSVFETDVESVAYVASVANPSNKAFHRLLLRTSSFEYGVRDNAGTAKLAGGSDPAIGNTYLWSTQSTGTSASGFVDGTSIFSDEDVDVGVQDINRISIGANNGDGNNANNAFDGTIQELIIYPSDQSATRTAIEGNINAHYDIYA